MADGPLSIKLRCASWQQLATIYRRDLSHGTMFLRAAAPPAVGAAVHIDLTLPSATVIVLTGAVSTHVQDPQRGAGVELKLDPIPAGSIWLIESALASEHKRLATPAASAPAAGAHHSSGISPGTIPTVSGSSAVAALSGVPGITDSADLSAAERDLVRALVAEAESLKQLNPFLVLGVGYEATDAEVRAAFGELTKRYHPDRFARYESGKLREAAAEIFILIRDAYRKLGDAAARVAVLQALGKSAPRAIAAPARPPGPLSPLSAALAASPPTTILPSPPGSTATSHAAARLLDPRRPQANRPSDPVIPVRSFARPTTSQPVPAVLPGESADVSALEALIDQGRLDEALSAYRLLGKKHPQDRNVRAGVELCEGLMALNVRDRVEAAQRFEAALEIDPSNERAARELADMRRQATNERKGLLSRLMGKKEP